MTAGTKPRLEACAAPTQSLPRGLKDKLRMGALSPGQLRTADGLQQGWAWSTLKEQAGAGEGCVCADLG